MAQVHGSVDKVRVSGCTLLSLAWSVGMSTVGRIGWADGDTLHSLTILWDELAHIAETGVIGHDQKGGTVLYELLPRDHDKLERVVRLLVATITDNTRIGVRAFNATWTLLQF